MYYVTTMNITTNTDLFGNIFSIDCKTLVYNLQSFITEASILLYTARTIDMQNITNKHFSQHSRQKNIYKSFVHYEISTSMTSLRGKPLKTISINCYTFCWIFYTNTLKTKAYKSQSLRHISWESSWCS